MTDIRKKAEAYAQRVVSHDIDAARFLMRDPVANARADFLAGYKYALKELEQIAREAWEARENSDFGAEFQDYWQKKTESKEAGND